MKTELTLICVAALCCSLCLAGCGGGQAASLPPPSPPASTISVTIFPENVDNLPAAGTQVFTATVTGSSNQAVAWSVMEGAWCGSVSSGNSGTGTYLAPNSPGVVCHVIATTQADSAKSDTATVTISPISMYVLPFQVRLGVGQMQSFAATVQGTSNPTVTWSVKEGAGGTITDQGVYTAPQTLGTFHVIATSQADPRFAAAAEVDVVPIAVTISPQADTLGPLGTRTFAASVVDTNQAVIWSIQEGSAGGSVTPEGVYTAPQNQGIVHVVATSLADTTASSSALVNVVASGFIPANPMTESRATHTATLLSDGRVLVAGGTSGAGCSSSSSTEIFDPVSDSFSNSSQMSVGREGHTATGLSDGKVLVAGGLSCSSNGGLADTASAELYDPTIASFTLTGVMSTPRSGHTSTLLPNGKVLVAGGGDTSGSILASAELYDPSTGTFTLTSNMQKPRIGHSATLLADGKVLIAGGYTPVCTGCETLPDDTAELYDPATGLFTLTGKMPGPIAQHTATRLTSGLVLIVGGDFCGAGGAGGGSECSAEDGTDQAQLYDPVASTFSVTSHMTYARIGHSATLLSDGKVLIAGGFGADPATFDDVTTFTAELYDPAAGVFSPTGSMALSRSGHTATLISNGRVLVTGGRGNDWSPLSSTEIYK